MKTVKRKKHLDTVQTAVRLPREMLERLRRSEHGISEGIKLGVTRMFDEEGLDAPSRELLLSITNFVFEVERETGAAWHAHAGAHDVFRRAILKRLARFKPEGPTAFGARGGAVVPSDDPDTIAGTIEYIDFRMLDPAAQERVHRFQEKSLQKIRDIQKLEGDKS